MMSLMSGSLLPGPALPASDPSAGLSLPSAGLSLPSCAGALLAAPSSLWLGGASRSAGASEGGFVSREPDEPEPASVCACASVTNVQFAMGVGDLPFIVFDVVFSL
jgi:hypothetical protein